MTYSILRAVSALMLGLAALSAPAYAHGDDGHSHDEPAASAAPVMPSLTAEGSALELVATAKEHTLTIYLDDRATNAPIEGAKIDVMGEGVPQTAATEIGDGVYEIEADWVHEPGTWPLTFVVMAGDAADLLAGMLVVPDGAAEADDAAASGWLALASRYELWLLAFALGLGGFFLGFAFRPLALPPDDIAEPPAASLPRTLKGAAEIVLIAALSVAVLPERSFAHEGHDHGPAAPPAAPGSAPAKLPSGDVFLPKATQRLLAVRTAPAVFETTQPASELVGTVVADPAHEGRVQAPMEGQIELAAGGVSYVGQVVKAGDVLALLAPAMPVYDRGSLQQATAEVEGKLRIAEQKLARLTRISGDYIPQREIDDTRTEIESLREQKRVLEPKSAERMALKAPVSGIISVATVRAGQVVSARDTLFEIVDPKRLWIEAIGIPGTDDESPVTEATALDADGHTIPLTFVGRAPALRQQALPLLFRVEEPHASLGIGRTVKVLARHGEHVKGIVVPDAAIVRAPSGLPQVWIKVAPERFAPRPVRTVPLDGERALVSAGLAEGDRIVIQAAELINQVR
ncbi:HlyD family efflux transporter periplasmic adaptor subunit [Hyphomicrobium sp.]|uniref:HlyD family efflux transporter periplasmic adaptor subunit n=1 Tax=Hyphomicrobium sp. TaxID=82 RepID=UPI002FDC8781